MLRQRDFSIDPDIERLNGVLEKVEAVLAERRVRQQLLTDLRNARQDIEFFENKIASAENGLRKENPEIESLQDSIEKASVELSRLVEEKESAEARYFRVKMSEKEFRLNISQLPKLNEEISQLETRVEGLDKSCQSQDGRFEQVVSQRMKYLLEIDELKRKADTLAAEIPLIQNTKDILSGLMPSDFDKDSYAVLQGDFEKNLQNYTNDIGEEIDRITRHVSNLKDLVENEKQLHIRLSAEKTELEKKYRDMLGDTEGEPDVSTAMAVLKQLEAQKINLIEDTDRLVTVVDRIKLEIDALDDKLSHEQSVRAGSIQRRIYLASIQEELKSIDDIDAHIRIQKEKKLDFDIEAGMLRRKMDVIEHVNQMLDALIDRLQRTFEDQNTQWIEFVGSLNRILF